MTTDDFTTAVHASAEQYRRPRMHHGTVTDREVQAHLAGWEAARAHLAAQEPTEAEVEAAALVVDPHSWSVYDRITAWERGTGNHAPPYPMAELVEPSMRTARAALTAAKEATR